MNITVKQSKNLFKISVGETARLVAWWYGEELVKRAGLLFISSTIVDVAAFCDAKRLDKIWKVYYNETDKELSKEFD